MTGISAGKLATASLQLPPHEVEHNTSRDEKFSTVRARVLWTSCGNIEAA
jgi:hypothetical protein